MKRFIGRGSNAASLCLFSGGLGGGGALILHLCEENFQSEKSFIIVCVCHFIFNQRIKE